MLWCPIDRLKCPQESLFTLDGRAQGRMQATPSAQPAGADQTLTGPNTHSIHNTKLAVECWWAKQTALASTHAQRMTKYTHRGSRREGN